MDFSLPLAFTMCPLNAEMNRASFLSIQLLKLLGEAELPHGPLRMPPGERH